MSPGPSAQKDASDGHHGRPVGGHQGVFTALCSRRLLWLQGRGLDMEVMEVVPQSKNGGPHRDSERGQACLQAATSVGCGGAPGGPGSGWARQQCMPECTREGCASVPTQMTAVGAGRGFLWVQNSLSRHGILGSLQEGVPGLRHVGCGVSQVEGLLPGAWEVPKGICWPLAASEVARQLWKSHLIWFLVSE